MEDADPPQADEDSAEAGGPGAVRAAERPAEPQPGWSIAVRAVITVLLGAALLGVGARIAVFLKSLRAAPVRAPVSTARTAVRTLEARAQDHRETMLGYGRVRALRSADVPAEIGAVVVWLRPGLEAGVSVSEGDELVRLDPRDTEAALAASEARVHVAEATRARAAADLSGYQAQIGAAERELAIAQEELSRIRALVPRAASPADVDRQRLQVTAREQSLAGLRARRSTSAADVSRAESEIRAAQTDVARARLDLSRAVVRAPFAGVVVERGARLGQRVAPGIALVSLVDLSRVEVPVALPASQKPSVSVGAAARLRVAGTDQVFHAGVVARVSPLIDARSRTFDVYVEVEGTSGSPVPSPGTFVAAEVAGRTTRDCIAIPRVAFVGDVVYVVADVLREGEEGDEALVEERRPVLARLLPDVALVASGIEVGERIVVTNVEQLANGTRVRIVREADGAPSADR